MQPSVTSIETLESGPAGPTDAVRRRRLIATVGTAMLVGAGALAADTAGGDHGPTSAEVAFAESWIDAWNDRDAQAASSMTCREVPAFVPTVVIEEQLALVAADRPVVGDHTVRSTDATFLDGRGVLRVRVRYVPATGGTFRERYVFVRVRDDGEMCIGQFSSW
jgi:hypothetical protein